MYQKLPQSNGKSIKLSSHLRRHSDAALAGLVLAVAIMFSIQAVSFVNTRLANTNIETVDALDIAWIVDKAPVLGELLQTEETPAPEEVPVENNEEAIAEPVQTIIQEVAQATVTKPIASTVKPTTETNDTEKPAEKPTLAENRPTQPATPAQPAQPAKPSTTIHNGTANWNQGNAGNTNWHGSDEGAPDGYDPVWPEPEDPVTPTEPEENDSTDNNNETSESSESNEDAE